MLLVMLMLLCVWSFLLFTPRKFKRDRLRVVVQKVLNGELLGYTYHHRLEVPAESSKQSIYSWKQNDVKKFYAQHELKGIGIV